MWNRGAVLVAAGVPVAVRETGAGGKVLALAHTAKAIEPGANEVVAIDLSPPPAAPTDLAVVLNDDGTSQGVVGECDTDNNTAALPAVACPVAAR
ncbi:MAG: hypothetical protein A2V77_09055 [Anaeromyxobacter sp. RBG_16_69_14]|nr:MAG: hypothetical protein A2V77_09055 [Anaeromyxobacter sp. RBG_16_69_14]